MAAAAKAAAACATRTRSDLGAQSIGMSTAGRTRMPTSLAEAARPTVVPASTAARVRPVLAHHKAASRAATSKHSAGGSSSP
jgi:hypothetical protein